MTPMIRPPSAAPTTESMPPRMTAGNDFRPWNHISGASLKLIANNSAGDGGDRRREHPGERMDALTLTPDSSAAVSLAAVARIATP